MEVGCKQFIAQGLERIIVVFVKADMFVRNTVKCTETVSTVSALYYCSFRVCMFTAVDYVSANDVIILTRKGGNQCYN